MVYSPAVAIVLGVVLLALIVLNVIFSFKEKNIVRTLKSIGTVVLVLVLTAGVTYGSYYLFQFIASLAGVIDVNMIGTITYSNVYIVIGIGLVALGVVMAVSRLAVKFFGITYRDITRAFAYIHAFLGAVLSFVLPDASYLFAFSGLMFMTVELLVTLIKEHDVASLHLEVLATALYMPIVLPVITLATSALGMTMAYIYGLVFALGIFNFAVYTASVLDGEKKSVAKRVFIPMVVAVFVCAIILFLCVSLTKPNASVNLQGKQNLAKLPYDDALIYVLDGEGNSEYRAYDLNSYSYFASYAPKMTYNGEYYVGKGDDVEVIYTVRTMVEDGVLNISKVSFDSYIYLTFSDINAESFTVDDGMTSNTFDLKDKDEYEIMIHSDCTVTVNGGTASVSYKEVIRDYCLMIPEEYITEDKFHFNLWLTDSFVIGK